MIGFKGFDKNWKCRNFQYEVGKTFKESAKPKTCNKGLHFCEMPLDVFKYYEPIDGNKFAMVEALGDIDKDGDKVATNKLKIDSEFSISDLFKWHFKLVFEKVENSTTKTATTGEEAHSATTGNYAHSATTGNYAHSATTGNYAHSATTGEEAISSSLGIKARAKAIKGWIIIVDWQQKEDCSWYINEIYHAKVGMEILGTEIKEDTYYYFENGELKNDKK